MHERITARVAALPAAGLHVLPGFHGNRGPLADPHAVGVISRLELDASFDNLCRLYWPTVAGITLGLRHILDTLRAEGCKIDRLHIVGGHTMKSVLMELYRETVGCVLIKRDRDHWVLPGTDAVAAIAADLRPDPRGAAAMATPVCPHLLARGNALSRSTPMTCPRSKVLGKGGTSPGARSSASIRTRKLPRRAQRARECQDNIADRPCGRGSAA
ncbi:MAG: FGGY-family carbohydrate kinase [Geminicoccaceae bacterium]